MILTPTDGMPAHSPPAQREAVRRDAGLTRIGLARAGQWQLLAQTAQREAERRAQRRGHAAPSAGLEGRALANAAQNRAHKGEWRSAASLLQSRGVAPPTGHTRDALARKLVGGPGDLLSPRVRPTADSGVRLAAEVADACVIVPTVSDKSVTAHAEAFQAVVWHLVVTHPDVQRVATKWESASG